MLYYIFSFSNGLEFCTEYAMKAATGGGNTAIAVRGANSAAFITQKKVPVSLNCFRLVLTVGLKSEYFQFLMLTHRID